jgi:WD40 repeat protein
LSWSIDWLLASASGSDRTVKVWNPSAGKCLKTLEGHSNNVMAVAWSIHGLLAIGSYDNTVKIWNPSAGECLKTLEGHSGGVYACKFAPKGDIVVSGSGDKTLKLWDVESGTCQATLKGHSPDNEECTCKHDAGEDEAEYEADLNCPVQGHSDRVRCVDFNPSNPGQLVTGVYDKTVHLWDVDSGKQLKQFLGHRIARASSHESGV